MFGALHTVGVDRSESLIKRFIGDRITISRLKDTLCTSSSAGAVVGGAAVTNKLVVWAEKWYKHRTGGVIGACRPRYSKDKSGGWRCRELRC